MSFATCIARVAHRVSRIGLKSIMVSAWWVIWAFVVGGYTGMLLIALLIVARKARGPGSVFE